MHCHRNTASSVTFAHAYNGVNQRISQSVNDNSWWYYPPASASTVSYTSNAANQYTAVGSVAPSYDGNGNLTSDGTFTYGYDAENRLISASGAGSTASYAFDGQGRRKLKTVNGTTTVYITDANNREVLEYDGTSGAISSWYAYGLGSNNVLNRTNLSAATRAALMPDIQGSIIASLDSGSGAITKTGYLPYGKSSGSTPPFAYTAQRIDPETNGLYYYRGRHYMPAWGRFMQPDPSGYQGGKNLYAYVNNDPLNLGDVNGRAADESESEEEDAQLVSVTGASNLSGSAATGIYTSQVPIGQSYPSLSGINPGYDTGVPGTSTNCVSCVNAFLDRMGGDTSAVATPGPPQDPSLVRVWGFGQPISTADAIAAIQQQDNPYGVVQIQQSSGVNHVIGYINIGGTPVFFDTQLGTVVTLSPSLTVLLGDPLALP